MKKNKTRTKKKPKQKDESKHMFASKEEYINYAYGSDPILCEALKNCCEEPTTT